MNLNEFMQSDIYINFLDELDKSLTEKIDRKAKVYDSIMNVMDKWLEYAAISYDELSWVVLNYREKSIDYIIRKKQVFTEPNGGKDNIVNQAPKINFPIGHLIEYYLLSVQPDGLFEYIKKTRIPEPKKYQKEIIKIFSELPKS